MTKTQYIDKHHIYIQYKDMKCSIEKCNQEVLGRGWCAKHYGRWQRNGSPLALQSEQHGMTATPEYYSWRSMKERCGNTKLKGYKNYGGRGIRVCERWINSFTNFYQDMGVRLKGTSLDRIDNNGNYEPGNCRWASIEQQLNNQRKRITNKSGYTGVSWYSPSKKWRASITIKGKTFNLGHFNTKDEAKAVYERARSKKIY